jgi:lipoprotein-anchoring transpeptidase ErfK/SrfK
MLLSKPFLLAFLALTAHTVAEASRLELDDLASPSQIAEELRRTAPETIDDGIPALAEPRMRIFVDKSQQFLWVEEDGYVTGRWWVSTGTEQKKCPPNSSCYVATTPVGVWSPYRMHEKYTSKLWDARMDYAIFFNGGIALHATYGENVLKLGTRQSGGCIRQDEPDAIWLFQRVKDYGMKNVQVIVQERYGANAPNPPPPRYGGRPGNPSKPPKKRCRFWDKIRGRCR